VLLHLFSNAKTYLHTIYFLLLQVCLESEEMSNLDSVVEDLTKAVERAPQQPYPIYSLASSFHRLASISQSMQLIQTARIKFQEALRKFPTFADGLILYALVRTQYCTIIYISSSLSCTCSVYALFM
jgi:tetratricopeptide (TPR) repeat protein